MQFFPARLLMCESCERIREIRSTDLPECNCCKRPTTAGNVVSDATAATLATDTTPITVAKKAASGPLRPDR